MGMQDYLMSMLRRRNPQGYEAFMQMRSSGKSAEEILRGMYSSGRLTDAQLNALARQMRVFGINVPQAEIDAIKAGNRVLPDSVYKGLF